MTGVTQAGRDVAPRPPDGPALDHPPTRAALARRLRLVHVLVVLAALFALSSPILAVTGTDLWGIGIYGAPLSLIVAALVRRRWRWMQRLLASTPWVARRGRYYVIGHGKGRQAVLVLDADAHEPHGREVLAAVMSGWMNDLTLTGGREGPVEVWVAGDPTERALASSGRDAFVPVTEPSWGWWHRYLEEQVADRESGRRPDLRPFDPPW